MIIQVRVNWNGFLRPEIRENLIRSSIMCRGIYYFLKNGITEEEQELFANMDSFLT